MENPNLPLITAFNQIVNMYRNLGDKNRERVYKKARDILSQFPGKISTSNQLKGVRGIGPSIKSDIDSFLQQGKIPRLEQNGIDVESQPGKPDGRGVVIDMFMSMTGVGPATAEKYYNKGYRTINDLAAEYEYMTDSQKIGYTFYHDLQERIPRKEIKLYEEVLSCLFRGLEIDMDFVIVGSYRRGEPDSGDIDILLEDKDLHKFMKPLYAGQLIKGTMSLGSKKFMGVIQLPGYKVRRLDVTTTSSKNYPFTLLHSTGSSTFNQVLRSHALQMGYTLNEYRLHNNDNDEDIYLKSEEEIMNFLGLHFIPPEKRVRNFTPNQLFAGPYQEF